MTTDFDRSTDDDEKWVTIDGLPEETLVRLERKRLRAWRTLEEQIVYELEVNRCLRAPDPDDEDSADWASRIPKAEGTA